MRYGKTDDVVEGSAILGVIGVSRDGFSLWKRLFSAVLTVLVITMWITSPGAVAYAAGDDSSSSDQGQATFSQDITDPYNVLGSNLTKVTDAISSTYDSTGVSVKLSYMLHFEGVEDPDQWAQEALDATNPKPNTVLLAVALNDGKLVVAVSGNSESWLYNKTTSDQLLKSAYGPVSGRNPDRHDGFHRHDQDDHSAARHGVEMGGHIRDVRRAGGSDRHRRRDGGSPSSRYEGQAAGCREGRRKIHRESHEERHGQVRQEAAIQG